MATSSGREPRRGRKGVVLLPDGVKRSLQFFFFEVETLSAPVHTTMPSPLLPSRPDGVPGHVVAPALRTSSTSIKLSLLLLFARRFRGWYTPRHPARCSLPGLTEYRARGRTTAGNVLLMSHNFDDHLDHTRRRERDSNPRYGVNRIHAFQACAFNRSATSPRGRHEQAS